MKQGYKNINEPPCKISFYQHVKVFKRQKNLEYTMLQSLVSGHINWNGRRERKKKHKVKFWEDLEVLEIQPSLWYTPPPNYSKWVAFIVLDVKGWI